MRRILAVVVGLTLAVLAACSSDGASPPGGTPICRADKDCGSGVCDPFRGCVDCRASSQCAEGEECLGGACRLSQPCTGDEACPDGLRCDLGAQTCVDCLKPTDCAAGSACVSGACQPASDCTDAKGCRSGTVCDLARATCVQCLGSGDCRAGERCVDQSCRKSCESDGACGAGLRCDPLLGLCLECVTSSDCAENRHCSAGRCALDVCVAGAGSCEAAGQAVDLCNSTGDHVVPLYCGKGATCEGEPGQAACSDWICTPGMSRCNAAGVLETCAKDGLSVASLDCADANQVCIGAKCVDIVCEPGTLSCDAATNTLHTCSANGTMDSLTPCAVGQYCDAAAGTCRSQVCTPGTEACVGDQHGVCDELGSGYGSLKACRANQTCVNAACVPIVCTPATSYCGEDGNAYDCNGTGTIASLSAICEGPNEDSGAGGVGGEGGVDFQKHCEQHGNSAACYGDPCAKGQPYCAQNKVVTCNAQGTAPTGPGTDCGADAACVVTPTAHCEPKVCTPSTRSCDVDGNVRLCSADGTSWSSWDICGSGRYCDPVGAYCQYQTCTPNAASCNGTVAVTCKPDGSTWAAGGTDCALSNKVCDAGVCKAKICEPYAYFCKGGNVNYCGGQGTTSSVADTCDASEFCYEGYYYCLPDVCDAGQPVCVDSTHLATCKADGSGPNGGGTDCGANKACDAGKCKAQVCTPYSTFCQGGHVQLCDGLGLSFGQYAYCFAEQYCRTDSPTDASCQPKVCTAGSKGCNGESFGTCDALGSGYIDSPTNCAGSNKVCSLTGCAASAVDEMGDSSDYVFPSTSDLTGDVFLATTSRTLSKLELESRDALTGTSIHWALYSSASEAGPYFPEFDVITVGAAAGFQSSGTIAVPLTSGRYYLAAVQLSGFGYFPVYQSSTAGPAMSFAQPLGHFSDYAVGVLPASVSNVSPLAGGFHFRFTTVP
jgi:hypothetical protein